MSALCFDLGRYGPFFRAVQFDLGWRMGQILHMMLKPSLISLIRAWVMSVMDVLDFVRRLSSINNRSLVASSRG